LILPESHIPVPMSGEDIAELKAIASAEGMNAAEYLGKVVHEFLQAKRAA
jgi:predicted DNA binding CopG/RHH family protein